MSIASLIRRVIRPLGYDMIRYRAETAAARFRTTWLERSAIGVVLDVGANAGQYAEELRAAGFRGRIASFEPLTEAYARLRAVADADPLWEAFDYALGNFDGTATIHVAANTESSSLLPMADLHSAAAPNARIIGTREIVVRRLDSIAPGVVGADDRIWLKVDVQGTESAVLEGAGATLDRVAFVEQELSLETLYEGQELIEKSIARLRLLGFVPVYFEDVFSNPDGSGVLQYSGIFRRATALPPALARTS